MSIEPGAARWIVPHFKQTTIGAVLFTQTRVKGWKLVPGWKSTVWWSACASAPLGSIAIQLLNGRWSAAGCLWHSRSFFFIITHPTCSLYSSTRIWRTLYINCVQLITYNIKKNIKWWNCRLLWLLLLLLFLRCQDVAWGPIGRLRLLFKERFILMYKLACL